MPPVKGNHAALNHAFSLAGKDLAASRVIRRAFHSFEKTCPSRVVRPPEWNLSLVLKSLTCPPYKSKFSSDKHLIWKMFLFGSCFGKIWMSSCFRAKVRMTRETPPHPLVADNLAAFSLNVFNLHTLFERVVEMTSINVQGIRRDQVCILPKEDEI